MEKTAKLLITLAILLALLLAGCHREADERKSVPLVLPTVFPSATDTLTPSKTPSPTNTLPPSATPTITLTPTITNTPVFSCPKAPPSRVEIDDYVRVTFTDGRPLRLRSSSETNDENIILLLPEGTRLQIVDGPVCVSIPDSEAAYVFWYVRVRSSGLHGWVAEGEAAMYYIEEYP